MKITVLGILVSAACGQEEVPITAQASPGLLFMDYRHLGGGDDGVALIDMDPESERFGEIVQDNPIGPGVLPHHVYFNRDQSRLYSTALSGDYLYEIILGQGDDGAPVIEEVVPIDTQGNTVAEDMYFSEDGSNYYITFMGGDGSLTGGTLGVFDAGTNELVDVIDGPVPADPSAGQPFVMYPHGISANEAQGIMMVSSTIHPDLESGVGNTITAIDLDTHELLETYLVADGWDDLSSPVEVLLLRGNFPPFALVDTMLGGDIWVAPYDSQNNRYQNFTKVVEGDDTGVSWPLEFYIHAGELYVSYGIPGEVHVYSLAELPTLPLDRVLPARPGAHHMVFFKTASGRDVVAIQNNLLNLDGLNAGTIAVVDIYTGEEIDVVDVGATHGILPESVESAFGHGHDYHH